MLFVGIVSIVRVRERRMVSYSSCSCWIRFSRKASRAAVSDSSSSRRVSSSSLSSFGRSLSRTLATVGSMVVMF